jgi:hypothetical protein
MGPQSATPYRQPDSVHRDLHRAYLVQSDEFAEWKTMAANGRGESRAYILGLLARPSPPAGAHTIQGTNNLVLVTARCIMQPEGYAEDVSRRTGKPPQLKRQAWN